MSFESSYAFVNFFRLSIASVDGKQHLSDVVLNALVLLLLLEKYQTFGREQPAVAGSHFRRVNSESSARYMLEHCHVGGATCLLTTPLSCATQHHVDDGGVPVVLFGDCLTLCCVLVVYNENPTRALNTA